MNNIHVVGQLPQNVLPALYRKAQAVIVPSLCHETFGLVAIEALAAGTPAIVRNLGALPELIDDGLTGYVYSSDAELHRAIHSLCDAETRAVMGRRARAAYMKRWTLERHMTAYLALVERLQRERVRQQP